jgi:hypothetical protein
VLDLFQEEEEVLEEAPKSELHDMCESWHSRHVRMRWLEDTIVEEEQSRKSW